MAQGTRMQVLPKLGYITRAECEALERAGHVVHIMPRKGRVRVDGFKLYALKD